jgi:hypothetical protein
MSTGYADPDSALELFAASEASPAVAFIHSGPKPNTVTPRFLHANFAAAVRAALPSDPELGPLAAAAGAGPAGGSFVLRDGLLYRRSPRGDSLCIPAAGPCCRSSMLRHYAGTLAGTRRGSPSHGAPCGGLACRLLSRSTCGPALRVSVQGRTPAPCRPAFPFSGSLAQAGLHIAAHSCFRSRLLAGAHRPPHHLEPWQSTISYVKHTISVYPDIDSILTRYRTSEMTFDIEIRYETRYRR